MDKSGDGAHLHIRLRERDIINLVKYFKLHVYGILLGHRLQEILNVGYLLITLFFVF